MSSPPSSSAIPPPPASFSARDVLQRAPSLPTLAISPLTTTRPSTTASTSSAANSQFEPILPISLQPFSQTLIAEFKEYVARIPFRFASLNAPSTAGFVFRQEADVRLILEAAVIHPAWQVILSMVPDETSRNFDLVYLNEHRIRDATPDAGIYTSTPGEPAEYVSILEFKAPNHLTQAFQSSPDGSLCVKNGVSAIISWENITRQLRKYACQCRTRRQLIFDDKSIMYLEFDQSIAAARDENSSIFHIICPMSQATSHEHLSARELVAFAAWRGLNDQGHLRPFDTPDRGKGGQEFFNYRGFGSGPNPNPDRKKRQRSPESSGGMTTRSMKSRNVGTGYIRRPRFPFWNVSALFLRPESFEHAADIVPGQDLTFPPCESEFGEGRSPTKIHSLYQEQSGEVLHLSFVQDFNARTALFEIVAPVPPSVSSVSSESSSCSSYNRRVVVKYSADRSRVAHEHQTYQYLRHLQGSEVPQLYGNGIYTFVSADGDNDLDCPGWFLVTEYISGVKLDEWHVSNSTSESELESEQDVHPDGTNLFVKALSILDHIHDAGVSHNDIAARNILVREREHGGAEPVLLDFEHSLNPTQKNVTFARRWIEDIHLRAQFENLGFIPRGTVNEKYSAAWKK